MFETQRDLIPLRTLVVDDSRVMRSIIMQALDSAELADFEYTEAGNGAEAIGMFDVDKTDIIFVDWNMPAMDGIEFARQIRAMNWANHIPIIMVTSESGSDKQQNAYEKARITCYVTKPFTVEELQIKLGPLIKDLESKRQKTTAPTGQTKAVPPVRHSGGFFTRLLS